MTTVTFLGTGTSTGVPEIGCTCEVCTSDDSRDKRLRTSVLINHNELNFLIDCGPDFRYQMIRSNTKKINAVLITHEHYDHVGGLDDLRPFSRDNEISVFAELNVIKKLNERMPYCFQPNPYPGSPNLKLIEINTSEFEISNTKITPIRVEHGKLEILGFRIGKIAMLTDLSKIPQSEYCKLVGLDILIIGALRKHTHHSHQTLNEAIAEIEKINPQSAYLIHSSHHLGQHKNIAEKLPENIFLSYDGLTINID